MSLNPIQSHLDLVLNGHATTPLQFAALWEKAKAAAQAAAETENAKHGPEYHRGFDCGFAWLYFPANTPWARWTKAQGISSKHYPSGYSIWYSKLHSVPTQSTSVHEAAVRAARDVIAHGLQSSQIYTGSRLD